MSRDLFFDAWMTYLLMNPFFTLLVGDPFQGKTGLILQVIN